jgi:hypothetical protein
MRGSLTVSVCAVPVRLTLVHPAGQLSAAAVFVKELGQSPAQF